MTSITAAAPFLTDAERTDRREARRVFMEDVVRRGLAKCGRDMTSTDIAETVCLNRRAWQRIVAGQDIPPRSVMKLFAIETGLTWETVDPARNGPYSTEKHGNRP